MMVTKLALKKKYFAESLLFFLMGS